MASYLELEGRTIVLGFGASINYVLVGCVGFRSASCCEGAGVFVAVSILHRHEREQLNRTQQNAKPCSQRPYLYFIFLRTKIKPPVLVSL